MPTLHRAALAVALGAASLPLGAQLVTPRTVPVHQADQFDILPSSRTGMANVWIALDDTLLDPFANPAKAGRLRTGQLFVLPYVHSISGNRGGGRTVPLGAAFASGAWTGMGIVAIQQLDRVNTAWGVPNTERTATNQYATGVLSRRLANGVTIGGAISLAGLGAVDGVDLMYSGSDTIRQDGSMSDLRLGLTKDWEGGRTWELVLVHNRMAMEHDVHTSLWLPGTPVAPQGRVVTNWDHNADKTNIWGIHSEYVRPFGTEGWRLGWLATANRISHPKIPNFRLMNIPRDPGHTSSFNAGVGLARLVGPASLGIDVIYEPMFSTTWADAASDTTTLAGGTIRAGGRTVENHFRFTNSKLRLGMGFEHRRRRDSSVVMGFQAGLSLGSVNYRLKQRDFVRDTRRIQDENWMEWVPTVGWHYKSRDLEFFYSLRIACISGQECANLGFLGSGDDVSIAAPAPAAGGGVIVAPSAPLTFQAGRAVMHRLTFRVPIR